jgi:hypothetical protein
MDLQTDLFIITATITALVLILSILTEKLGSVDVPDINIIL